MYGAVLLHFYEYLFLMSIIYSQCFLFPLREKDATQVLSHGFMHWVYTAVVKSNLLYGALVWCKPKIISSYRNSLESVQLLATLFITGALRTTPLPTLKRLLNLPTNRHCSGKLCREVKWKIDGVSELSTTTYGYNMENLGKKGKGDGWRMVSMRLTGETCNICWDRSKMNAEVAIGFYTSKHPFYFCPALSSTHLRYPRTT